MGRILFIDDEPGVNDGLVALLQRAGHRIERCHVWRDGVEWLRHEYVDIVLAETSVPHIRGLETLWEIRKIDARVPMIALASGPRRYHGVYLSAAMGAGARYAFGTPYDEEALVQALENCLRRRGAVDC